MSNPFNNFLGQVIQGAGNPKGNLADFAHASRLYVDNTMALAPKNGWIFYVVFNINQAALNNFKGGPNANPGLLDFLKNTLKHPFQNHLFLLSSHLRLKKVSVSIIQSVSIFLIKTIVWRAELNVLYLSSFYLQNLCGKKRSFFFIQK